MKNGIKNDMINISIKNSNQYIWAIHIRRLGTKLVVVV